MQRAVQSVESTNSSRPISNNYFEQSKVLLAAGFGVCSRRHVCGCEESESSMLSCTIEDLESGDFTFEADLHLVA